MAARRPRSTFCFQSVRLQQVARGCRAAPSQKTQSVQHKRMWRLHLPLDLKTPAASLHCIRVRQARPKTLRLRAAWQLLRRRDAARGRRLSRHQLRAAHTMNDARSAFHKGPGPQRQRSRLFFGPDQIARRPLPSNLQLAVRETLLREGGFATAPLASTVHQTK
jgi:hypothetical protein